MFFGESVHPVDDKGRAFVPKRFHKGLQRDGDGRLSLIVSRGFEGCLFVFSTIGFEDVLARLKTQAFGGAELRKMQRLFFANTHEVFLDASGRIILPEKLREYAGIQKKSEVVMVGVADRAEIWSRPRWEAFQEENEGDFEGLDVVLCGGGDSPPGDG